MNAKTISFTLMMGALGNVLFVISYYAGNLAPGIALDFSLIAAFIAGFYGGPLIGLVSGLFVGIMPGIMFGPLGMSAWLGLIGLPIGKALTGLTAGFLYKKLGISNSPRPSTLTVPVILLSYIPECFFTITYFLYMVLYAYGYAMAFMIPIIIPKAWIEIALMSLVMGALAGNTGFKEFALRFLQPTKLQKVVAKE